ncbi:hypothetical protein [Longimicrobium sp.]|uniref:hypothetical protein n=1 Tax=Longimicrobium sp. TaxID=2029185 RepID=UPI002CD77188|nr:hypothetical protein [Longimicrobium sp.]HSU15617.1 hypothetical protein [Longimicrobium sp.]
MRKLELDIDEIRVESFRTTAAGEYAGTVLAHSDASNQATCDTCQGPNCGPPPSNNCA